MRKKREKLIIDKRIDNWPLSMPLLRSRVHAWYRHSSVRTVSDFFYRERRTWFEKWFIDVFKDIKEHWKRFTCSNTKSGLAYLAAVNRVPLTPPKQLADTNIGIKNQNIPIIFFAKVYGIKIKLNIKLNKLEKERVVN